MKDKNLLENPTELLLNEYKKERAERSAPSKKPPEPKKTDAPKEPKGDLQIKETKSVALYKTLIFGALMIVMSFIGMLFFLRPEVSETENRKLAEFPKFQIKDVLNGDFFVGVDKWYSDTFPGRDLLIGADMFFESLYGVRDEQIIGNVGDTDEIPDVNDDTDKPSIDDIINDLENQTGNGSQNKDEEQSGTADKVEKLGSLYLSGNSAFEIYGFNQSKSDKYAAIISLAAKKLEGKANVHNIIVPISYSFGLSEATQKSIGASDGEAAIKYMFSQMTDNVNTVDIFSALYAHKNEYIFFRTDHHWTALGAYYAYVEFCKSVGITPTSLEAYTNTREYTGFLGTFYTGANKPAALEKNPDTVHAYIPNSTNDIKIIENDGTVYNNFGVISGVSSTSNKYLCFLAGDHPLSIIDNPNKNDGSSILVVKESFGNAFAPFLVDSYDKVYVVDYRYYTAGGLDDLVDTYGIKDVLFLNTIMSTAVDARQNEMTAFINR